MSTSQLAKGASYIALIELLPVLQELNYDFLIETIIDRNIALWIGLRTGELKSRVNMKKK